MTRSNLATTTVALCLIAGSTASASQNVDGALVGLHELRREGRLICMVAHWHTGSGSGPTQKSALTAAVRDWSGFTAWEYGNHWGLWRNARSKTERCTRRDSGGFECVVDGRPCKPMR
ncbi:MAG: DUF995 domain-containing protein [Hyphomicrobiaceae bacterium]